MYIGIDLGGTNIAAGIMDQFGKILLKKSIPTRKERFPEDIVKDIIKLVESLIEESFSSKADILGIGIGIPGVANEEGVVTICVNLNWYNVPLKKPIEDALGISVFIDNDGNLAALAEYRLGIMKDFDTGVFITLGTGVGGGIILDGKIISGRRNMGGEIGHMIVGENFYDCNCGRNGCLETFASSTAIIKYVTHLISSGEKSCLMEIAEGDISKIDGKAIFKCAQQGDEVSLRAMNRFIKYLAIGIVNIISMISPDIFAIGGGLSEGGKFFIEDLKKEVNKMLYFEMIPAPKIEIATLKNDAGIIGAGFLAEFCLSE